MSGAARALVPIASANRLSGTMSALTLMSVIAPVVPSAPQGSSGEAASGFQSLLAALSGESATAPETKAGPAGPPATDEVKVKVEAEAEAGTPPVAAVLIVPVPQPIIVAPLPPDDGAEEPALSAAPDQSDDAHREPSVDRALNGANPPLPLQSGRGLTSWVREAQSAPPMADDQPQRSVLTERPSPPAPAGTVAATAEAQTVAIPAAAAAAAAAVAAATTTTTTSQTLPQALAPTPAPLRPLAERTSRPVEPASAKSVDGAAATDPARPMTAMATASAAAGVPVVADQTTKPEGFVAALAAEASKADAAEDPAPELRPLIEGGTTQTQSPTSARETAVSQLSRVTVEATAQIAAQILRRLEGRSTRFEMALTPDELGRVDVKLDIDSEGRLNARLAFDNPAAATDLRGRADELRRQLEAAGFHLADDAFEFADRDSGSSAFDRGDNARKRQSRAFTDASRLNAEIDVAQPPRWMALSLSPSGVDMKV